MLSRNALRVLLAALAVVLLAVVVFADSQVRAVRLSFVEGNVQIDRGDGSGFGPAYMNMPVTQSTQLKTGDDGRAEVELEDGSAIRLTPNTAVDFPRLSLTDSGSKVSTIDLQHGTAYCDLKKPGKDSVSVTTREISVALDRSASFRIQEDDGQTALAILNGEAEVSATDHPAVTVKKDETFKFSPSDSTQYFLAKGIESAPFDDWNRERQQYLEQYAANRSYENSSPLSYGYSDLSYYGNFVDVAGYGSLWQPAFVGSGWSPFANGAWAYYPGLGYSWVSAYPWGWLPYHYGNWVFLPNYGWCWQPGYGYFYPVNTVVGGPAGFHPPQPPTHGHGGVIVVGEGPRTIFPSGRLEPGSMPANRGLGINGGSGQSGSVSDTQPPSRSIQPQTGNGRARGIEPQPAMRSPGMPRSTSPSHSAPHSTSHSVPHAMAMPSPSFGSSGHISHGISNMSSSVHGARVH